MILKINNFHSGQSQRMLSRLRTVLSRASAANCMIGCPDGAEPIGCPDGADGGCAAADLVASAQDGVERSEVAAHDDGVAAPSQTPQ